MLCIHAFIYYIYIYKYILCMYVQQNKEKSHKKKQNKRVHDDLLLDFVFEHNKSVPKERTAVLEFF